MSQPPLSIKWIIIGAAIIAALNQLLTMMLGPSLGESFVASMGTTGGFLMLALIVALGSFFVGGLVVGWLSPGETLMEPAIAAAIAIVVNFVILTVTTGFPPIISIVGTVALGFALGLAGAKVGERLQGDTTDKMRERGEL